MDGFNELLAEIQRDCGWEHIPYDKITLLARMCGPEEIDRLIDELDALDDADLEDDAGDMGDEYWRLRTAYRQTLREVGEPAVEALLRALGSENAQTRVYAAQALAHVDAPQAFHPILALLTDERNGQNRMGLISAIGDIRDARAVPVLLSFLKTPEEINRGWMIRMAANALGKIGTEVAIGPLSEILLNDHDWFARIGAAEGLRKISHPRATEALRQALNDPDERVRAEVARLG